jgi:RNA polymerase sigma factor (TIGR02999 family)
LDTQVTALLQRMREGDSAASEELMPLMYHELHRVAARYLRRERPDHTLQPTALVNEAYLKLFAGGAPQLVDRAHFLALASQVMRRILVDHARSRNSDKRGGEVLHVTLNPAVFGEGAAPEVRLLELDIALDALASEEPRLARAVELHYFGGLTAEEAAEVTGRTVHSARHDLRFAHAWLRRRLAGE